MSFSSSNRKRPQSFDSYRWVSRPKRFRGREYHEIGENASDRTYLRGLESPAIEEFMDGVLWIINKFGPKNIALKAMGNFDSAHLKQAQDFRSDDVQSSW